MFPIASPTFARLAQSTGGQLSYLRKQWMDDPFAHGGNSYLAVGAPSSTVSVQTARKILASAAQTRPVFWAGEATETAQQPASVHGAHMSGLRAAFEIGTYLTKGR